MRRPAAAALAVLLLPAMMGGAGAAEDPEARGDRLWARRAEGFAATGRVDPAPAAGAVAAYEKALRAHPQDLRLRFKLAEALYFAGHFADRDPDTARARFDRAVEVSEEACSLAAAQAGSRSLEKIPEAVDAHFWAAVSWGLWGLSHGNLAAAAKDVAGRIRGHAALVAALDPAYRDAAGWRLLGRLHTQVPHVPLVTGWVDREQGIALLRKAAAASTQDARNPLFLAEALLEYRPDDPADHAQALELLRGVAARQPRAEALVEESEMIAEARQALARLAREEEPSR